MKWLKSKNFFNLSFDITCREHAALAQTSDTSFSGGIDEVIATIDKNNLDETEKEGLLEITFVHLIGSLTETDFLILQNF